MVTTEAVGNCWGPFSQVDDSGSLVKGVGKGYGVLTLTA